MALTLRANGSGPSNQINSTWFNDFYNLLTGNMPDQVTTLKAAVILSALGASPAAGMTATPASGAGLGIGVYKYTVAFVGPSGGESAQSAQVTATTTTGNQKVNLAAIPTGATGTVSRKLYRTVVGGTTMKLLTTIADNVTTTFADTTVDGSLGASPPSHPSFGGTLQVKDSSGTVQAQIFNDGYIGTATGGYVQTHNSGLVPKFYSGATDPATYDTVPDGSVWYPG